MNARFKPRLLAVMLAASALTTFAQPAPDAGLGGAAPDGQQRARFHERAAQRATALKAKLKLSAAQESAWNTYVATMRRPAHASVPSRADIAKLTTPERLDRMRELRKQREAEFDKRDAATRSFYAALSPEQKKIFDDNTGRPFHEGRQWGQR